MRSVMERVEECLKKVKWMWKGREIEEVREYKYLGYIMQANGGHENKWRKG